MASARQQANLKLTPPRRRGRVVFPRLLHVSTVFGLQHPFTTAFLAVVECTVVFVLLYYAHLVPVLVSGSCVGLCGFCMVLILHSGWSIWSCGVLEDMVDFLGESHSRPCFSQAKLEIRAAVVPCIIFGLAPVAGYFWEIRSLVGAMGELEKAMVYCLVSIAPVNGCFLAFVASGHIALVRLLAAVLKKSVHQHFDFLEQELTVEGISRQERIRKLDGHCKRVKSMFQMANECVTRQIFSAAALCFLVSLILLLELVVDLRAGTHTVFMLTCFGGASGLTAAIATALLHSITSVADHYEDIAAELSHNIELRFKVDDTFNGPAAVKLLSSFEKEHVNELSFNFHHRPLDARFLEGTLFRMFLGAMVTIVVGIVT